MPLATRGRIPLVCVDYHTSDYVLHSGTGEDFQRIEFGVDEVMDAEPVGVKDPMYKVSSTLNPQAPEFILGCQASQKAVPTAMPVSDVPDGSDFNSVDCPDSEPSAMDSAQAGQELDGMGGGLGQRERKKKKKRPPGYYNYLEGSGSSNSSSGGMVVADGPLGSGLVNGHSLGTPSLTSEDMNPEGLSGAEHGTPSPTTTPSASIAPAPAPTTSPTPTATTAPAHQRTCASPDESSLDLTSGAPSSSSDGGNNAASSSSSSSSSSQSGAVADGRRTAEQPPERPELLVGGGHSPCPTSPPPPMLVAAASPLAAAAATTEEGEEESIVDNGVANGLAGPSSTDGLEDSSEAGEAAQSSHPAASAAAAPPAGAQSPAEQVQASAVPVAPAANPPKSWASLFHNSKPLPGSPQAYVEVKNVPAVTATSPAAAEVPEKAGEVREGPVPVAEDPMAPKLAGNVLKSALVVHRKFLFCRFKNML